MRTFLLFVTIIFLFTGCSIYYPQIASVQMPSEKGDLEVTGAGSPLSGAYLGGSYSPSEHFAVQTHFNTGYFNYYGDVLGGYYHKLGNNFIISDYLGFSLSHLTFRSSEAEYYLVSTFNMQYNSFFNQLYFGYKAEKVEIGTMVKFGNLIGSSLTVDNYSDGRRVYITKRSLNNYLLDNVFFLKFKSSKGLGLCLLLGWSSMLNDEKIYEINGNQYYIIFTGGLGLTYQINLNKNKHKEQ